MKKLLFIGKRYHGYTTEIVEQLELLGYAVRFYDIEPWNVFYKLLRILMPARFREMRDNQQKKILQNEEGIDYEVVLFLQAHQFSVDNVESLKARHPNARFILYNWDSLKTHDYRPQMHVFDRVLTFDREDAKMLGIGYLPLFCVRGFQALKKIRQQDNAVYFVGNVVNAQRYEAVSAFKSYCRREHIEFKAYLAGTMRMVVRLVARGFLPTDISLGPIAHEKFIAMIESSTAVFDFANHAQSGYTMRTIENLCAGKKLITNNPNILQESFYSPDRIFVFEGLNFSGVAEFLVRPITTDSGTFDQFHIQTFVRRLLA